MANVTTPENILRGYFQRNGYVRMPNLALRRKKKHDYKKGYEVRLVAFNEGELQEIRRALRQMGFALAKFHKKVERLIQPIYGKRAVERFTTFCGEKGQRA